MKKMILTLTIAIASVISMNAQNRPSAETRAQKMTERMSENLSLTEEQEQQVYKLNLEMAQSHEKDADGRKAKMEAHDARLKEILTEEQYKKHKENQKTMTNRRKHLKRGDLPPGEQPFRNGKKMKED